MSDEISGKNELPPSDAARGASVRRALPREPRWELNAKALQTRQLILDQARTLFLERGYAGTRIEHITTACGLSRGAFYAYFASKLEVFEVLGTSTYKSQLAVMARLGELPKPCALSDVRAWVTEYFEFMAEHGAFMLSSAQGGPQDPEFRDRVRMLTVRTARRFGRLIEQHSGRFHGADAALGVVAMSTLERSWFYVYGTQLKVKPDDVMDAVAETLHGLLLPVRSDTAADASTIERRSSR
jgi:TetR/AcrR family transcriptional regulator